jgi:hypothetical protein
VLLIALSVLAFLLVWVLFVTLLGALGSGGSYVENFSLVAMVAICLIWVIITLGGLVKSKAPWVRGSAVTINVLLFAAGTGCLQLGIGSTALGFGLVALALVGFFAAIASRPVMVTDEVSGESDEAA